MTAELNQNLDGACTNLFLLTELNGLKWQKYLSSSSSNCGDPILDDQILNAYAHCLQQGYLVAWRRQPINRGSHSLNFSLCSDKELWVFWYTEEPDMAHFMLKPDDRGDWESMGVEYQTRIMLYKALHNAIERCLLNQSTFIRVGRWFTELQESNLVGSVSTDTPNSALSSTVECQSKNLAFAFSFHLYGDNRVACSVRVSQLSSLRLLPLVLFARGGNLKNHSVLLLPWAVQATLTGQEFRDEISQNLYKAWSKFYPLPDLNFEDNGCNTPFMAEVLVGGISLRWPIAYIASLEESVNKCANAKMPNVVKSDMSPRSSGLVFVKELLQSSNLDLVTDVHPQLVADPSAADDHHVNNLAATASQHHELWRFKDSLRRTDCQCARGLGKRSAPSVFRSKAELKFGMSGQGFAARRMQGPFHRRSNANSSIPCSSNSALSISNRISPVPVVCGTLASAENAGASSNCKDPLVAGTPDGCQVLPDATQGLPCNSELEQTQPRNVDQQLTLPSAAVVENDDVAPVTNENRTGEREHDWWIVLPALSGSEKVPVILNLPKLQPTLQLDEDELMPHFCMNDFQNTSDAEGNQMVVGSNLQHDLQPAASLPDDFLADDGETPSLLMSPPPSTEQVFEVAASHSIGIHSSASMSRHYAAAPDYSTIFPTPPSADLSEQLPNCVYELPITASYVSASGFSYMAHLPSNDLPSLSAPPEYQSSAFDFQRQPQLPCSSGNVGVNNQLHQQQHGFDSMGMSPMLSCGPQSQLFNTPKTPASLQSPPSNTSSAYVRNVSSVEMELPEAHSVAFVLLLSDTFLNQYPDASFDSCPVCACIYPPNLVGWERGLYSHQAAQLPFSRSCLCGFSASRNRYLSVSNGLFFEDELESAGVWRGKESSTNLHFMRFKGAPYDDVNKPIDQNGSSIGMSHELLDLIRLQCFYEIDAVGEDLFADSCAVLLGNAGIDHLNSQLSKRACNAADERVKHSNARLELLHNDFVELCHAALEEAVRLMDVSSKYFEQVKRGRRLQVFADALSDICCPIGDQRTLCFLRALLPYLQEALQKPRGLWAAKHDVEGPVAWRNFQRRCFTSSVSTMGAEEHCSVQEPCPAVVVASEKDWLAVPPQALALWDGLLLEPFSDVRDVEYIVVSPDNHNQHFILNQVRSFFREVSSTYEGCRFGTHKPITKILREGIMRVGYKMQASIEQQISQNPQLANVHPWFNSLGDNLRLLKLYAQISRIILAPHLSTKNFDSPMLTPSVDLLSAGDGSSDQSQATFDNAEHQLPVTIIYMVNPWPEMGELAVQGLMRCFLEILTDMPETSKASMQLQIVPLSDILQTPRASQLRQLCSSIYSRARSVHLSKAISGKTLTGLISMNADKPPVLKPAVETVQCVWNPRCVLWDAPAAIDAQALTCWREQAGILLVSYLLTPAQDWLLLSATDHLGVMLDSCIINLLVPERRRIKKDFFQEEVMRRIWDWVMSVLSLSTKPWRLVVGKMGRLGYQELNLWARYLSKNWLKLVSRKLREQCTRCPQVQSSVPLEAPSILSACLVSLETEMHVQLLNGGGNRPLDSLSSRIGATHILVFPTSAHVVIATHGTSVSGADNEGLNIESEHDVLGGLMLDDIDTDFLMFDDVTPTGNRAVELGLAGGTGALRNESNQAPPAEDASLQLQPLAIGYYFNAGCPPLRSALHVHTAAVQQSDDFLHTSHAKHSHPLDSTLTSDVLNFVLNAYHSLSWLNVHAESGRRLSFLPLHMQVLVCLFRKLQSL